MLISFGNDLFVFGIVLVSKQFWNFDFEGGALKGVCSFLDFVKSLQVDKKAGATLFGDARTWTEFWESAIW